jgi:hypothetical protein
MKKITAFFIFLSIFNILDATDEEYAQLLAHLKARGGKYAPIARDFGVDARTVSNFVKGNTSKPHALLKNAKEKYPNIFQQQAPIHPIAAAPLAPNVLPIIHQLPIVQQPIAPALNQHLSLPNLIAGSKYVISMVPMNSSGDSYHILAYLILSCLIKKLFQLYC